jgi:hypothetical protein
MYASSNLTEGVVALEVSLNTAASSGKLSFSNWNTYAIIILSTACSLKDV